MPGYTRSRILAVLAGAAITAGTGFTAASAAQVERQSSPIVQGISDFFTPSQFDQDGSVYGVKAKPTGSGSLEILTQSRPASTSLTPDPCSTAGFPNGWCATAHTIAANAFGWNFHVTGAGVTIGIVDTGIDINNPEFLDSHGNSRVLTGSCIVSSVNACTGPGAGPTDNIGGDNTVFPGADSTHGTHVAGIAAGLNTGIAPGASILPVKVCASNADACNGVDQGMIYAATHGASIVSVSIGGPILSAADIDAFRQVAAAGALMVVAAGNGGSKNPTSGFLSGAALQPGVVGNMLVVGASTCNGNGNGGNCANGGIGSPSSFGQQPSSRCEIHGGQSFCMRDYFVMAPGVDIWSSVGNGAANAGPNYGYLSGTSMATPFVSGVAALVKSQNLSLTASQVAQIIIMTADDLGAPGHDPIFGAGMVDVTRALAPISLSSHPASVPTSGSTSLSFTGTSNALGSFMSGPLTGALRQSTLLKSALVLDSFDRPYTVDLTKFVNNRDNALTDILMSDNFSTFSPFAASFNTAAGALNVSGLSIAQTTPALISGILQDQDKTTYQVRELLIDAPVSSSIRLNVGYNVDSVAGLFNEYDANGSEAYAGLFMAASGVNSPYVSLTNGGSFIGSTLSIADDLRFNITESDLAPQSEQFGVSPYERANQANGLMPLYDQRRATATVASLNWDAAKWVGFGVTASQTSERNGLLGGTTIGALSLTNNANTSAVGMSARVGFGDGWVTTASYSEGITQLDLSPNNIMQSASDLRSRSYGVAVAKHGLFGTNDSLGLALSRPIEVYSGTADLVAANGADQYGNLTYGHENLSLVSKTPETDVELGYVTTFLGGALALQANAAYQMNFAGQSGTNALAVVSRAKINF